MDTPPSPYADGQPPSDAPPRPDWVPAYSWGIPGPVPQSSATDLPPENPRVVGRGRGRPRGMAVGEWFMAPPTSHISRFMYDPEEMQLMVVFKGPEGKGEVAEYVYHFPTPSQGKSIFDAIRTSAHPYGSVLKPDVIDTGIPYSKVF